MSKTKNSKKWFPKCVDRRHDCHWIMEDGTCALLNVINKKCSFYKTTLDVALANEKRQRLCRERGVSKDELD